MRERERESEDIDHECFIDGHTLSTHILSTHTLSTHTHTLSTLSTHTHTHTKHTH